MTVDEALNIAVIHTLSIKHGIAVSEAAEAASILAAEVRRLRDEVNGLTGSLDRAEKALKEEQEPVAFWWIGPDGKDNGGPYRGKPSDSAIDNARNMGCEPVLLYARPVPAAPAEPSLYVAFTDNDEHIRFWTRSKNAADLFRINHPDWPVIEFFSSPLQSTGDKK